MSETPPIYDLVGVGFGPANLALAIALTERDDDPAAVFLERQPGFGWHRGMLLDDATMQVSFLKDLVTLRNPASPFSFVSYLHQRGRLLDFVNHKSLFPLRVEFHDYLEWAAEQVAGAVHYGHDVIDVAPVVAGDVTVAFDVIAQGPRAARAFRTRNVVFATGLRPSVPDGVTLSDRVIHSHELLRRVDTVADPKRLVVVGAGQSAAEVTAFLHTRFPAAEICAVFSRYGYSPADDSPFANRIFDPAAVGDFFGAPADVKTLMLDYHGNTNYSVVDGELIDDLYRRVYREKVTGEQRLQMRNMTRLVKTETMDATVRATVRSLLTGEQEVLDADLLVCATGYHPADPSPLIEAILHECPGDDAGRLRVGRDYRVVTDPRVRAGIYLQGGTEHTHGISSSLLSNVAIRAGEILDAIRRKGPLLTARR